MIQECNFKFIEDGTEYCSLKYRPSKGHRFNDITKQWILYERTHGNCDKESNCMLALAYKKWIVR